MSADLTVLSLGAGVQSSAVLLAAIAGDLPTSYASVDAAIFADTGDEPEAVYAWLERLKALGEEGGVPVFVVRHHSNRRLADWSTRTSDYRGDVLGIPAFVRHADGTRGIGRRSCTREFKMRPVRQKIRELLGTPGHASTRGKLVHQLIGISTDEAHRMKPSGVRYIENRYPLIDLGWNRDDARKYVEATINATPPRSACVYCPFHSDEAWRQLRDNDPKGWAAAVEVDAQLRESNRYWREEKREGRSTAGYDGDLFLHRSCLPLAEVEFRGDEAPATFGNECEGMCGV